MASVLIDNWSIDTIFGLTKNQYDFEEKKIWSSKDSYCRSTETPFEKAQRGHMEFSGNKIPCWYNILMAVILWDEINVLHPYPPDQETKELRLDMLKPLKGIVGFLDNTASPGTIVIMDHSMFQYIELFEYSPYGRALRKELFARTSEYLFRCSYYGVDFLPHPIRSEIAFKDATLHKAFVAFNRQDIFNNIDKIVLEYYDKLNDIIGRRAFICSYPVLFDYIRKNSNSVADELKAAIELRSDKDVIRFRKSLDDLDEKVNAGDITAVDVAFKQIKELSMQIANKHTKSIKLGELTIGLSPSFKIPISIRKQEKILNMTFISRLVDFGLHDRLRN